MILIWFFTLLDLEHQYTILLYAISISSEGEEKLVKLCIA